MLFSSHTYHLFAYFHAHTVVLSSRFVKLPHSRCNQQQQSTREKVSPHHAPSSAPHPKDLSTQHVYYMLLPTHLQAWQSAQRAPPPRWDALWTISTRAHAAVTSHDLDWRYRVHECFVTWLFVYFLSTYKRTIDCTCSLPLFCIKLY